MYYVVFGRAAKRRLLMAILFGIGLVIATIVVALPGILVGAVILNKFSNLPQTAVLVLGAIASVSLYLGYWTYRNPNVVNPRRKKVIYSSFPLALTAKA